MAERISREDLVRIYNIELTFFDSLQDAGLLKTENENEIIYLNYEDLPAFERLTTWHYDLEVNLPGLEVLQHLIHKVEELTDENRRLRQRKTNYL